MGALVKPQLKVWYVEKVSEGDVGRVVLRTASGSTFSLKHTQAR